MNKLNILTASILVATLGLTACNDNNSSTSPPVVVEQQQTISGMVTDDSGNPIDGAVVTLGNQVITTNDTGTYSANLTNADSKVVVLVQKKGYLTLAREVIVRPKQSYNLDIALTPDQVTAVFASSAGVMDLLVSGAKVSIPANAITNLDGSVFTGTVQIAANYYNPDSISGAKAFAQPFAGQNENGSNKTGLVNVGVIDVKLTDPATGDELYLNADSAATFIYPAASTDQDLATIPLWYYDESKMIWVKEGVVSRQPDGSYKAEVSHFNLWSPNIPVRDYHAFVEGCVIDATTKAPFTDRILGYVQGRGYSNTGSTDTEGKFKFVVPLNTPLTLSSINYLADFDQQIIPALAQNSTYQINNGVCLEATSTALATEIDLDEDFEDNSAALAPLPVPVTPNPTPSPTTDPFEPPPDQDQEGLIGYSFVFEVDDNSPTVLDDILLSASYVESNNVVAITESLYGRTNLEIYDDDRFLDTINSYRKLTPQGFSQALRTSVADNKLKFEFLNTSFNNNQSQQSLDNGLIETIILTDLSLSGLKIGDVIARDEENRPPTSGVNRLNNSVFSSAASCKIETSININMDYIFTGGFATGTSANYPLLVSSLTLPIQGVWAGVKWAVEPERDETGKSILGFATYDTQSFAAIYTWKDSVTIPEAKKDDCTGYNTAAKDQILAALSTAYPEL